MHLRVQSPMRCERHRHVRQVGAINKELAMKNTILITALIALLAIGAYLDQQDEQDADSIYTAMVCAGHWPDYDNREPECL